MPASSNAQTDAAEEAKELQRDVSVAADAVAAAPASEAASDPAAHGGIASLLFRGFGWTTAARGLSSVGNVVKYAVFARMLSPIDFGITAVALSMLDLLSAVTNASFERALIQQEADVGPYLDTVFTTGLSRGLIISILIVLGAHPLAIFFKQGNAYLVFIAVAPIAMLRALQSPAAVLLHRRMEFHIVLILNAAELGGSFLVGIVAIIYLRDWRGLLVATAAGQLARTALSYWYFPYRPRLRFNRDHALDMFKFGRWLTGAGVAEFAAVQLDNFIVAHLLGPQALGEYQLAFRMGETPASEFAISASIVAYPLVSRLGGRRTLRHRLLMFSSAAVVAVGLAYAMMIHLWGRQLITLIFHSQWLGALAPLKLLCYYGLFQGLLIMGKTFLEGIGAPSSSFGVTAFRAVALAALIYPMTLYYGTSGAAGAAMVSVIVPVPLMFLLYLRSIRSQEPKGHARTTGELRTPAVTAVESSS